MSSRLVRAIKAGKVVVENRTNAEVVLRFIDNEGVKTQRYLPPRGDYELCPKHSPIKFLKFSNVKDLIGRRAIRVVVPKKDDA
jgi:hypothetical protein